MAQLSEKGCAAKHRGVGGEVVPGGAEFSRQTTFHPVNPSSPGSSFNEGASPTPRR